MIFLFFFCVYSNIFSLKDNDKIEIFKSLSDRTVVLLKTTIMIENPHTKQWQESDENIPVMTQLKIYKSDKLSDLSNSEIFVDKKYDKHNVFFFTSHLGTGLYNFDFEINTEIPSLVYGLKVEVFEGSSENPEIMSGIDYHMTWLTQKIGDLLTFARNNLQFEEMGDKDELEYVRLYNYIFRLVFWISFLKISVLLITIFYVNKSVKDFFITFKIIK